MTDTIQFSKAIYRVSEDGTSTDIPKLTRTGNGQGTVTIKVSFRSGSGGIGTDLTGATQTITWQNGDTSPKPVVFQVIADDFDEGTESIKLTLSNIKNGVYGENKTAIIEISDRKNIASTISDSDLFPIESGADKKFISLGTLKNVGGLGGGGGSPTEIWDDTNYLEFYLDTVNGDDNNDGLSQLTPRKTWEAIKQLLGVKSIGNEQRTFIYVNGTLQAPLDFSGLHSFSVDPNRLSQILICGSHDANWNMTPFTLQGVTNAFPDKRAFKNLDHLLSINLQNVIIDIPDRITFSESNITFRNTNWQLHDTTAPYSVSNDAVICSDPQS